MPLQLNKRMSNICRAGFILACILGCSDKGDAATETDTPGDGGQDGYQDIEVIDGKVRFYLSEADGAARKAAGTGERSWAGTEVSVNGKTYDIATDGDGRYYIDAEASSSGSYNAVLTTPGSEIWYGASAYADIRLPYSQFRDKTGESLKTYPMYASYTKENGNKLVFNDAFAVLDITLTGEEKITSVKIEDPDGKIIAGYAHYLPSQGYFSMDKGVSFAVLNCTGDGGYVQLDKDRPEHFCIMAAPGEYTSGLEITITDSGHRAMEYRLPSVMLTAGQAKTVEINYSPDSDLVFHESFDSFVWGGNIMGGQGATGYAPTGETVTPSTGTGRSGYEYAFEEVTFDNPGSAFIQSNTWDEVSGKTVATSHLMSESYINSRNIGDYTYMFRCQEYQGVLACGTGNTGRGIFQTAAMGNIRGLQSVKVSFDFCYQSGSTDLLLFQIINGGMITEVSVNGSPVVLTPENSGYSGVTGKYIIEKNLVTLPPDVSSAKEWQHVEVTVENATDGTMLYWAGNDTGSGVHGFYLDNIEVRSLGSMAKGTSNLRVLYWNIQNGMWSDQAQNYDNFIAWVKKYDPDICVWCESATIYRDNTSSAQDASQRFLPDGWASLAARYGHSYVAVGGWRDNYPQTVTSRYPIKTLLKITDTDEPGKPVSHGAAIQQVEVNGHTVNLVTLHTWPQAYGFGVTGTAEREASKANNEGDKYREFEIKYICGTTVNNTEYSTCSNWLMLGDFNSRSRTDNWYYGYPDNDTRLLVHDYILGNTDMVDIISERYPGAFVSTTYGNARIDYIYASPSMYGRIVNACVLVDGWTTLRQSPYVSNFYNPSDHRPIIVDFEMK